MIPTTIIDGRRVATGGQLIRLPNPPNTPIEFVVRTDEHLLLVFEIESHGRPVLDIAPAPEMASQSEGYASAFEIKTGAWQGPEPFPPANDPHSRELTAALRGQTLGEIRCYTEGVSIDLTTHLLLCTSQGFALARVTPIEPQQETARKC